MKKKQRPNFFIIGEIFKEAEVGGQLPFLISPLYLLYHHNCLLFLVASRPFQAPLRLSPA
jgi:hypothetical protein